MKKLFTVGLILMGLLVYSCTGIHNSEKYGEGDIVSNAPIAPVMMDGSTPPSKEEMAAAEESKDEKPEIDTEAKSDSKGVGDYKEVDIPESIDGALASKGEEVFNTYCTACHLPTEKKLIGPGLKNITKIRTPEWVLNMISNPSGMIKEDPVAKQLFIEANQVPMTDLGLSKDDVRAVYEFLRQNDNS